MEHLMFLFLLGLVLVVFPILRNPLVLLIVACFGLLYLDELIYWNAQLTKIAAAYMSETRGRLSPKISPSQTHDPKVMQEILTRLENLENVVQEIIKKIK
jgi:hypothetical protein